MSAGYHFRRVSDDATDMTLHDGNGVQIAAVRCPPSESATIEWLQPRGFPERFPDVDAVKQWIADNVDQIFGG